MTSGFRQRYPGWLRFRFLPALVLLAIFSSAYSSCAGSTGPLLIGLSVTPSEVLLRASAADGAEAVGLARIDGGDAGSVYQASVEYGKRGTGWLTVEVAENELTLRANPDGLAEGVYLATVTIEEIRSRSKTDFLVEFMVTP